MKVYLISLIGNKGEKGMFKGITLPIDGLEQVGACGLMVSFLFALRSYLYQ